jgi:hypothetical protein
MAEDEMETISPADMRQWLQQEIRDLTKAFELRVKDATDFVSAYSQGELTPRQAMDRMTTYQHRWSDALEGAAFQEGMTNEQVIQQIDSNLSPVVRKIIEQKGGRGADPKRA